MSALTPDVLASRLHPQYMAMQHRILSRMVYILGSHARREAPMRTGRLARSISGSVSRGGREGTIRVSAPYATMVHEGTRAHVIRARRRRFLRFESNGSTVFRRSVMHPGTRPNRFLVRAWEAAMRDADPGMLQFEANVYFQQLTLGSARESLQVTNGNE